MPWISIKEKLPDFNILVKVKLTNDVELLDFVNEPLDDFMPFQHYHVKEWRYPTTDELNELMRRAYSKLEDLLMEKKDINDVNVYKNGLNDGRKEAWELARLLISPNEYKKIGKFFEYSYGCDALLHCTAEEAIRRFNKYKEYEELHSNFKRGEIVEFNSVNKTDYGIYLGIFPNGTHQVLFSDEDLAQTISSDNIKKTGQYIDIDALLLNPVNFKKLINNENEDNNEKEK